MSNLTAAIPPQTYGSGPRKVDLGVKNGAQIFQGAMVAQIAGACVTATTANAGDVIGVAEHDQLGSGSDNLKRLMVLTDGIFLFKAGIAAPTDTTSYGTTLFVEDDNSVGTGGLGSTQQVAGTFEGMADDGRVRVFVGKRSAVAGNSESSRAIGTPLTDTATTTIQRGGRYTAFLLAGTMSQDETVTLGTTGAVKGDIVRILRTSTSAHTLAVVNGGAGAGTLCTLINSKIGWAQAWFDGTNWLYDGSSAT